MKLDNKPVAGIDLLMKDENFMNTEWMSGASGDGVAHNLEQMLEPGSVVDVEISDTIMVIHEECELEISVAVFGLKASRRSIACRRMMQ